MGRSLLAVSLVVLVAGVVVAFAAGGSGSGSAERWVPTVLEDWESWALAINEGNRVVGSSEEGPWVWEEGRFRDLLPLKGYEWTSPSDINDRGQIAGTATRYFIRGSVEYDEPQAVEWVGDTPRAVAGPRTAAFGIDERGRIVGGALSTAGSSRAFVWSDGTRRLLATPKARESQANSVNERGQIVGWISTETGKRAVVWQEGRRIVLRSLGGVQSEAFDVNDRGDIVGWSETTDGKRHATLWQNGRPKDLGSSLSPSAINNRGQVVGSCGKDALKTRACVWQNGKLGYLPSFGYRPADAHDINDNGWIVGSAINDLGGEGRPVSMSILWTLKR